MTSRISNKKIPLTNNNDYQILLNSIDEKIKYEFDSFSIYKYITLIIPYLNIDTSIITERFIEIISLFEEDLYNKVGHSKSHPIQKDYLIQNFTSLKDYFSTCMSEIEASKITSNPYF